MGPADELWINKYGWTIQSRPSVDNASPIVVSRLPSPTALISACLAVIGIVMLSWGCGSAVQRVKPLFAEEPADASADISRYLNTGTSAIYVDAGVNISAISVFAPDGSTLAVRAQSVGVSETVSRPAGEFRVVAKFDVERSGVHRIDLGGASAGTQVLIGPPVFAAFFGQRRAMLLVVSGLILACGGAWGSLRRRSSQRA